MGSMKEKRKNQLHPPFAAETKDVRFAGTFGRRELDTQPRRQGNHRRHPGRGAEELGFQAPVPREPGFL